MNLSVLKAGFRKCHRRPQHRLPLCCELRALCSCVMQRQANTNTPHLPRIPTKCRDNGNCTICTWLKLATNDTASCKTRLTRGRVRELKNGHNSVTVQIRTHVYMNFFLSQKPRKSPPAVMSTSRETPCTHTHTHTHTHIYIYIYTGCPRRNGQNFGRVFLMLNYTDITQNTYIQS